MSRRCKFYTDEELLAIMMNSYDEIFDENENDVPTSDEDEISETEADLDVPDMENDSDSEGKKLN